MGKPIEREYDQEKTILKFFDYKGAACVVPKTMGTADEDGNIVIKAGTPFPSNDEKCLGYLLADVDVTRGDAPGTYVFEGSLLEPVITENGITITDKAKAATPRVTFFEN